MYIDIVAVGSTCKKTWVKMDETSEVVTDLEEAFTNICYFLRHLQADETTKKD